MLKLNNNLKVIEQLGELSFFSIPFLSVYQLS